MYRNVSRICNINIKGAKESIQLMENNSLLNTPTIYTAFIQILIAIGKTMCKSL